MKIIVINGPNLNVLGKREQSIYGGKTLPEIITLLRKEAESLHVEVLDFQSNSEGSLIDYIQKYSGQSDGIIINPGALTHYGISLKDALVDTGLPIIEVHLSNIYARENWRANSVISPVTKGQITGLGWRGYIAALQILAGELKGESCQ